MSHRGKRGKERTNEGLRLTDKKHPKGAILSTILAVISIGIFALLCFLSGESNGNSGLEAGILGILCFCISIAGFILAWISLHQENIRPFFPTIGALANGLMMLFYLMVYIWGTAM